MSQPVWTKSTYCDTGACVEVADLGEDVGVRNTTEPEKVLRLPHALWEALRADLTEGKLTFEK